ncbi:MAG: hypothetical protein ACXW11_02540 [Methylotenera sp.]
MFSVLNKKLSWTILIWFAVLQMLSPLIHAHVETDASEQGHGLHMHVQELVQGHEKIPAFKNVTASLHTVGVDKALVKVSDLLPAPLFAVLFVLCSLAAVRQSYKPRFNFLTPLLFYLRPQSRPRAPPLF